MENKPRFKNGRICRKCGIEKHISEYKNNIGNVCYECQHHKEYSKKSISAEYKKLQEYSEIINNHLRDIKKS